MNEIKNTFHLRKHLYKSYKTLYNLLVNQLIIKLSKD